MCPRPCRAQFWVGSHTPLRASPPRGLARPCTHTRTPRVLFRTSPKHPPGALSVSPAPSPPEPVQGRREERRAAPHPLLQKTQLKVMALSLCPRSEEDPVDNRSGSPKRLACHEQPCKCHISRQQGACLCTELLWNCALSVLSPGRARRAQTWVLVTALEV